MPRVGSLSRMMRGRVRSHLPITTFCWLPPESEPTGPSRLGALMLSSWTISLTARSSARRSTSPKRPKRCMAAKTRLSRTDMGNIRPSALRSSGMRAMPASPLLRGPAREMGLPKASTWPVTPMSAPKRASSSSRCPCPSRPPRPTTSPGRTVKQMSLRWLAQERWRTRSAGCSGRGRMERGGNTLRTSRPIIISTISLALLLPAVKVETCRPLR